MKAKLGRPRKGNELKSETLAIKTSPSLKDRLAEEARVNRRSLTEEVETRLTESLDRSDIPRSERTARLLEEIARNIYEIESAIGKNWHEDVAPWAAVREMLYHGPIVEVATGDAFRDAKLDKLTELASAIEQEKSLVVMGLRALGIDADQIARHRTLGDLMQGLPVTAGRESLRTAAVGMDELTEHQRNYALMLIERLEQLDAEEQANEEARAEAVEHLREGIEKGRATYSRPPRNPALDHALWLLFKANAQPGALLPSLPPQNALLALGAVRTSAPLLQPRKALASTILSRAGDAYRGPTERDDDDTGTGSDAP